MSPNTSSPKWLNRFEILLLGATAIISGFVAVLDFLGLLDGIPWLAGRVPTLTLLVSGSVATYLVLERRNQLESMQKESSQQIDRLERALIESTTTIIESLQGVEFRKFGNGNELMQYVNRRLRQAQHQVDDLSWSPAVGMGFSLPFAQELTSEYTERKVQLAKKIPYREVFIFNRPNRLERLRDLLECDIPGYSCAYYEESKVTLLQFMIIDKEEVIILSDQIASRAAIRHPNIAVLFSEYFEEIWKNAIPIKLGSSMRQDVIDRILGSRTDSQ